jgi:hypothetical protein
VFEMGGFKTRVMGLPYWSFKQKLRLIKKFEKDYCIEDLERDKVSGILYMEKRRKNLKFKI